MGMTMVELVDYKCAECGKIEQFRGDQNRHLVQGLRCAHFHELRRSGTKRIDAV